MPSGAISAQGSQFFQGTGSGSAITITDITQAFKAEVTGTHSLSKGDRVALASIVGMTEANGLTVTVLDVTGTTSFVIDLDTRSFTPYSSAGTATPVAWTQVKELKDFKPGGAQVPDIDRTNLDSEAREYIPGLVDNGDVTFSLQYVAGDPGQAAAENAFNARATKQFKLVVPNGDTFSFQGYYKKFPNVPSGATDGLLLGDVTVRIDGVVTRTLA